MRALLVTDTHFTNRPNDQYRFDLFRQVEEIGLEQKVQRIIMLGDLLDAKDNHPGVLVNRVVDGLVRWTHNFEVQVLQGNHDGLDASTPYLRFINHIPGVEFIGSIKTETWDVDSINVVYLPHTRNEDEWNQLDFSDSIVFAHVTVDQAMTETGFVMEAMTDVQIFEKARRVYSGDIHRPQNINNFTYVGCAFNVRFGDGFDGRVMVIDTEFTDPETKQPRESSFYLPFPRKLVFDIKNPSEYDSELRKTQTVLAGEAGYLHIKRVPPQVKVRLHLSYETLGLWREYQQEIREISKQYNVDLCLFELVRDYNIEPSSKGDKTEIPAEQTTVTFESFCADHEINGELRQVGKEVVEEVFGGRVPK